MLVCGSGPIAVGVPSTTLQHNEETAASSPTDGGGDHGNNSAAEDETSSPVAEPMTAQQVEVNARPKGVKLTLFGCIFG